MTSPGTGPGCHPATGYKDRVTAGLLYDALKLLDQHGIIRADDEPWRVSRALEALCRTADAIAGPTTAQAAKPASS